MFEEATGASALELGLEERAGRDVRERDGQFVVDPADWAHIAARVDGQPAPAAMVPIPGPGRLAFPSLGTISDVVGLTSTFMGMTGLEIPGLSDLFGGGGPDWGEIVEKIDQLDVKLSKMLQLGEELKTQLGSIDDKIDAAYLSDIKSDILSARANLSNYAIETDPARRDGQRSEALNHSEAALNRVTSYFESGGASTDNPGKDIGLVLGATLIRVAAIEELDDGAFAKPAYKTEFAAAANMLRASAADLQTGILEDENVQFESYEYFQTPRWSSISTAKFVFTNAVGTERVIRLYFANNSQTYGEFGSDLPSDPRALIDVIEHTLRTLTEWEFNQSILPEGSLPMWAWFQDTLHTALQQLRDGLQEDIDAFQIQTFLNVADGWDALVEGEFLGGSNDADDVIVANDAEVRRDVLSGFGGNDTLIGGADINTLLGGDGDDVIFGNGGDDRIKGGAGDDLLDGGIGDDRIDGGDGVDTATYAGAEAGVVVDLGKTAWQNTGGAGTDALTNIENLIGSAHDDTLTGNGGANVLSGLGGSNVLNGMGGNDVLLSTGSDTIDGGAGVDTVSFAGRSDAVVVTLAGATSATFTAGGDAGTIINVENVIGGEGADRITGDAMGNELVGGSGADVLDGGAGNDTIYGDSVDAEAQDDADTLRGGAGADTFLHVSAGSGVDVMTGGAGRDTYRLAWREGAAADIVTDFQSGAGGDFIDLTVFGADAVDGFKSKALRLIQIGDDAVLQARVDGAYQNVLILSQTIARTITVENFTPGGGFKPLTTGPSEGNDTLTGTKAADALSGFGGDDELSGGNGNDVLSGGKGNDRLFGGNGNDLLDGGEGKDAIAGGAGTDTVTYANRSEALAVALDGDNAVTVRVQNARGKMVDEDTLSGVENVIGGSGSDRLSGDALANLIVGNAGDDILAGGGGNDVMDGGEGTDTVSYAGAASAVTVNLATGRGTEGADRDQLISIENVIGSAFGDSLTGDAGANILEGGDGDDVLLGDAASSEEDGADTMLGGKGADTFLRVSAGAGVDRMSGGGSSDTYVLAFTAGNAADIVTDFKGGAAGDVIDLSGFGAAGNNGFASGHFRIVGQGADALLQVDVDPDRNVTTYQTILVLENFDPTRLTGANFSSRAGYDPDLLFVGGDGPDRFIGGRQGETLDGGGGDDFIRGGGGRDVMNGGAGYDIVDYGDKTDPVVATLAGKKATVVKVGGVDEDTIRGFEAIYGGRGADVLTGDDNDNLLRGGDGADVLDGGAGNDTADFSDKKQAITLTLNGAQEATARVGGIAEDRLINIENLWGGSKADTLTGDSFSNILRGGGGRDVLNGGGGFDYADYRDKTAAVTVSMAATGVTNVYVGGIAEDRIRNIEGIYGGGGDDSLWGNERVNRLSGGDGNDTLASGGGKDILDGGAGYDIADYSWTTDARLTLSVAGPDSYRVTVNGAEDALLRGIEELRAGGGDDHLSGLGGILLDGGAGHNTIDYAAVSGSVSAQVNGAVWIDGVMQANTRRFHDLVGGSGDDVLIGDAGANLISGGDGDDRLIGGAGDTLDGGAGFDIADFSAVFDPVVTDNEAGVYYLGDWWNGDAYETVTLRNIEGIVGGAGDDMLRLGSRAGMLAGGDGNDILYGGAGDDILIGGADSDSVYGGAGADTFVFRPEDGDGIGSMVDYIDYNAADGDKIDLTAFNLTSAPSVSVGTVGGMYEAIIVDMSSDGWGTIVFAVDDLHGFNADVAFLI